MAGMPREVKLVKIAVFRLFSGKIADSGSNQLYAPMCPGSQPQGTNVASVPRTHSQDTWLWFLLTRNQPHGSRSI